MLIAEAIIRGIIPLILMTIISILIKYQGIDSFQFKSTCIVGIIIASVAAASVVYEIENWSLFKQSGVHFVIMVATVFSCLLVSGWFKLNTQSVWNVFTCKNRVMGYRISYFWEDNS